MLLACYWDFWNYIHFFSSKIKLYKLLGISYLFKLISYMFGLNVVYEYVAKTNVVDIRKMI